MCFGFFSRWNGCRWRDDLCRMTGGERRSCQKSLSALFLLLYRELYGFNNILTSRNRIFILKSIIIDAKNQSNQFPVFQCGLSIVLSKTNQFWWSQCAEVLQILNLLLLKANLFFEGFSVPKVYQFLRAKKARSAGESIDDRRTVSGLSNE